MTTRSVNHESNIVEGFQEMWEEDRVIQNIKLSIWTLNTTTNEVVLLRQVFRFFVYLMTDAVFVERVETGFWLGFSYVRFHYVG